MNKKIAYTDAPGDFAAALGSGETVADFLPPPEQLVHSADKHKTTQERLVEFYGKTITRNDASREGIDWGSPVGNELW